MWLNMDCLCAIYVNRNQQAFLAQVTSFVMRYDVTNCFFPFNSQYLMTWGVDSPAFYVWEVYFLWCLSSLVN